MERAWLSASTLQPRNHKRSSSKWPSSKTGPPMVLTVPTEATLHLPGVPSRRLERELQLLQGRRLQRRVHFQPHREIPPLTRPRFNLRSKTMETHLLLQEQHKTRIWSRGLAARPRANAHVPASAGFHRFLRVQELVCGEDSQVSLKPYSVMIFA